MLVLNLARMLAPKLARNIALNLARIPAPKLARKVAANPALAPALTLRPQLAPDLSSRVGLVYSTNSANELQILNHLSHIHI